MQRRPWWRTQRRCKGSRRRMLLAETAQTPHNLQYYVMPEGWPGWLLRRTRSRQYARRPRKNMSCHLARANLALKPCRWREPIVPGTLHRCSRTRKPSYWRAFLEFRVYRAQACLKGPISRAQCPWHPNKIELHQCRTCCTSGKRIARIRATLRTLSRNRSKTKQRRIKSFCRSCKGSWMPLGGTLLSHGRRVKA